VLSRFTTYLYIKQLRIEYAQLAAANYDNISYKLCWLQHYLNFQQLLFKLKQLLIVNNVHISRFEIAEHCTLYVNILYACATDTRN